jgi:hypothetical protein
MNSNFQTIIKSIIDSYGDNKSLCSFNVSSGFNAETEPLRKLNSAFLIVMAGENHAEYNAASTCLSESKDEFAVFLRRALSLIKKEVEPLSTEPDILSANLSAAAEYCNNKNGLEWDNDTRKALWSVFFPEGVKCLNNHKDQIAKLREKRTISITQLNQTPISSPADELLFTSNILLTIPASNEALKNAGLEKNLTERIRAVSSENQLFWFDHPIQIGVETDKNEVIYGLRGLNDTCAFEKARGNMATDAKATCVLSASVTHKGLHDVTQEYLEAEFAKIEPLEHLNIYIFTEHDTGRLIDKVLSPLAQVLLPDRDPGILKRVFGVDGEYGRHYSFLKAVSALWQVMVNETTKATFKIDLDQVFPQDVLVETTGKSAFEHYMTPLWGAKGTDSDGETVELGMIAGALVNEDDISKGLYTPDVNFPESIPSNEGVFFMSGLPMALSTEAEMGTRYSEHKIDGTTKCIQRVHVTGGTNGILTESLRKSRPFTPTFIGRAEDQAYLMSALFSDEGHNLRYLHCDGLIMRHDKYAFAGKAIEDAKIGRQTGDLVRILYFSAYAKTLPWDIGKTKNAFDPFTGCFISNIPVTVVMMRLCTSIAEMFEKGDLLANELAAVAIQRLGEAMDNLDLSNDYAEERAGWDLYYDILDSCENAGSEISAIREQATALIQECQIK